MNNVLIMWEAPVESGTHLRTVRLQPGRTYYIGRPRTPQLREHPWMNPYAVYIIPADGSTPIDTGLIRPTVSRLDTKIALSPDASSIQVTNHGPDGKGSLNPTYVDNQPLPRGATRSYMLSPGRALRIDLTTSGPTFIIMRPSGNTATLTLTPNIPTRMPVTIARKLESKGLLRESISEKEEEIIVVKPGRGEAVLKIRVGEHDINFIIKGEEKLDTRKIKKENLQKVIDILKDLEITILKAAHYNHTETQLQNINKIIEILKMNSIREAILEIGKQANKHYNQIILLASQNSPSNTEFLLGEIEILTTMIEKYLINL